MWDHIQERLTVSHAECLTSREVSVPTPLTVQGSDGNDYQRTIISDLPGGSDGKVSAYNVGDLGSIPGSGRSPGEGKAMATHSSILAWKIPWTEEPGSRHSPRGRKESDTTE